MHPCLLPILHLLLLLDETFFLDLSLTGTYEHLIEDGHRRGHWLLSIH